MVLTRFGPGERKGRWTSSGKSRTQVFVLPPPTERDGQGQRTKGLRGEDDRVSVVQHGMNRNHTGITQDLVRNQS